MDFKLYLEAAQEASRAAGRLLIQNLGSLMEVSYKGEIDLVTNFDKMSQSILFEQLSRRFPEHDFLAEEDLCQDKGSSYRWVIDPLDGTTNYAHHFPVFGVSVALKREKDILLGVVFDPAREEMFSALRGEGAFLNGSRIKVSSLEDLGKSLLATGFPYDIRKSPTNNIDHFTNFILRAQDIRRCGSAALDLCSVACGRFDGFWELKLKPWDVAAGALIVEEAGGRVSDFTGEDLDIFGAECLASNGLIHSQMLDVLRLGRTTAEPA